MAKLLENTYRHVNIALVNEMAIFCHELGVDLWDAIRCAATKPFGFQAFYPGPGVGGHCIPIDPNYLSYKVRTLGYPFRFVELAQEINGRMPGYVVDRAAELLNRDAKPLNGASVLLLGVTYKQRHRRPARIAGPADRPQAAAARGAVLSYHDPYVDELAGRRPGHPPRRRPGRRPGRRRPGDPAAGAHLLRPGRADRGAAHLLLDTRGVIPAAPHVEAAVGGLVRVVVCTVVHHPADARIFHRQIRALLEAGHQVTYIAPAEDGESFYRTGRPRSRRSPGSAGRGTAPARRPARRPRASWPGTRPAPTCCWSTTPSCCWPCRRGASGRRRSGTCTRTPPPR